ncbi:MAG: peptidylprolyl isomerase [Bryobacteraceae bacterium]
MSKQISLLLLPLAALLGQTPAPKPPTPKPAVPATKPAPKPAAATTATPAPTAPTAPAAPAVPDTSAMPGETVILTIGSEKMTKAQWEELIAALPERVQAEAKGANRKKVAEQLAEVKAMAQEAQKRKLDQTAKFQAQMGLQKDQLLAQALYQELTANLKTDDAAAKVYYDANQAKYESITARHILVRMKGSPVPLRPDTKDLSDEEALARAKDLKAKLDAGAKFDELAKTDSDDTGSGANGGALGTFPRGNMVPAFEQAAFAQTPGKVSEPVKTQFGYHLILVDEKKAKSFDEAKPEIEGQLKPEMAKKAIETVKNSASPVYNEAYFGK